MTNSGKVRIITIILAMVFITIIGYIYTTDERSISNISISSSEAKFNSPNRPIMSEIGNATLKAQLGRSSWHLLHTMSVKFPLTPTVVEQQSYMDFISLFAKLYPCGDCALHFQGVLRRNPPRVKSRDELVEWTCDVHNEVNLRLEKPIFNCTGIAQQYLCGCGDEPLSVT